MCFSIGSAGRTMYHLTNRRLWARQNELPGCCRYYGAPSRPIGHHQVYESALRWVAAVGHAGE